MADAMIHPAASYAAVTKSDSTDQGPFRALYIGVTGDVVVSNSLTGSNGVTFKAVPVGILPVQGRRVMAATTATDVVALF